MTWHLINANVAEGVPLKDESVHCVITSPPYYRLRDYEVQGQRFGSYQTAPCKVNIMDKQLSLYTTPLFVPSEALTRN